MEDYLNALSRQLKGFPPEEQAALIEEIASHIESGEADPGIGQNTEQRRKRLMAELGSPQEMGKGFKAIYRSGGLIDYLWIAIPYALYPFLNMLYINMRLDLRFDILLHLPLIAIGLWRRSAPLALFWIITISGQLLYIATQGYWQGFWYYGIQTVIWALLLFGLLILTGMIIWKNRHDALVVMFALLPLSMLVFGNLLAIWRPTSHTVYSSWDVSLLNIFLEIRGLAFYVPFATMAMFFLPANRNIRWMALLISGLWIGLGRDYLLEYQTGNIAFMAHWVHTLWAILPLIIVAFGWWLDQKKRLQLQLAL